MPLLNLVLVIEFLANTLFWWFGIFILLREPKKRINQITAGFFIALSTFYSSDILSSNAPSLKEYTLSFRAYAIGIYFAVAFFYHLIFLTLSKTNQQKQRVLLIIAYIGALILPYLDAFTNLIADYSKTWTSQYFGNWIFHSGPLLNVAVGWGLLLISASGVNTLSLLGKHWHDRRERIKYLLPALAIVLFLLNAVSVSLHYTWPIPYFAFLFSGLAGVGSLLLSVSIVFYGFVIGESLHKDKIFQYSSITMAIIVAFYIILIGSIYKIVEYRTLVFLLILIPATIATHYAFDWLNNLTRNIIYNRKVKFSVVNDNEVANAIRFYHRPSRLENSSLLNLKVVEGLIKQGKARNSIDALQLVIEEAINFLKPKEENRRTKQAIKYHLLRMLAFDQAEEGQMLWELGFEEYPVRIMSQEGQSRPPKLKVTSPADYTATSRNAFINLKQEAIHDVTWRISYLEKLAKRQ